MIKTLMRGIYTFGILCFFSGFILCFAGAIILFVATTFSKMYSPFANTYYDIGPGVLFSFINDLPVCVGPALSLLWLIPLRLCSDAKERLGHD